MKIHCFRHAEFEYPGHISSWAQAKQAEFVCTDFFAGQRPPHQLEADLLVILGGPMGVYDEKLYPWLTFEKKTIENAIQSGTKILGICLGAQLIASVMGAPVYNNDQMEVGWHRVTKARADLPPLHSLPNDFDVFHWHGDTFDIPDGAIHTFSSSYCLNQGFYFGNQILGFQFHPEIDQRGINDLLEHEYRNVVSGPGVQSPEIIRDGDMNIAVNKNILFEMLDSWMRSPTE